MGKFKRLKGLRVAVSSLLGVSIIFVSPGVSYAKITPKYRDSKLVIIKKGDTLWDLAGYYYHHPYLWQEFKEYNIFTDPHWIYPGEKLAIDSKKATQISILLEKKVKELKAEKEKDEKRIDELELEIKRLKGSAENMAAQLLGEDVIRNLVTHKEDEIMQLKKEVTSSEEKNDMLKSAILELQMKMVESQATINMQTKQIEELTNTRNIALNAGYFLGFAAVSTILAGKVVK
ncbi:MAG: LysM peptidoglycan-binding domain-containing protein [bacterium]|nr:LysM peptidoglycan-binding domain-containing protein [bacterium]